MTTPTAPARTGGAGSRPAGTGSRSGRSPLALLGLAAAVVLFALLTGPSHPRRAIALVRVRVDRFTQLPVLVAPLLAMLVAARSGHRCGRRARWA